MISLPHAVRVYLHTPRTDLRKGFDALSGLVTTAFRQDPTSGHLFLFVNRRRDRLKILYWDRDGLAIWYKRLETCLGSGFEWNFLTWFCERISRPIWGLLFREKNDATWGAGGGNEHPCSV